MLETWGIWIVLFATLLLGVPIYISLGISTIFVLTFSHIPLDIVPLDMVKVGDMFPLLAIPAFIFAGAIMERGGMADQIIDVAKIFVGKIRGGLALVTILGCMFFAAMIGSGPGTVAAMGTLMLPAMLRAGYDKKFGAGVCATGGTLGILIPPSNPMIIYGVMANVSVGTLFMAGMLPGAIVGTALMLTCYFIARKRGYKGMDKTYTTKEIIQIFRQNIWSLMAPVIILGGIYSGIFTPVEASAVACFYALFVGRFILKKLTLQGLWDSIKLTNITSGTSMIIVGVSVLFGRFLTLYEVPQTVAAAMLSISNSPEVILLLICLMLFMLGMFMETLSTIVILVPILLPVIIQLGIDPVFFGILWVLTNEVALLTPPLGANVFIAMTIGKLSLEEASRGALPFMLVLVAITVAFIFMPDLILFVPRLLGNYAG
ncbi:TRAP transporter large permease [Desulforamulus aquiferis]|uniref:TRAP transporter large permease n=1 Tax=Desulforamulus aquiferis TaxID=1397668 RepID=A0AAW7ZD15_9FIRM|nr:TRAP transporter large permease [Desulforamulus aquiferis]MDO7787592.1 TRAP transporter large permease [Desulforamulus aquiferis]RYD01421.1 hypothetical protein N752_30980 [Desulforamulus aquiferis]